MDDAAKIAAIVSKGAKMVHAGDPSAYEAFRSGKGLFDVSPDGRFIDDFKEKNRAEFEQVYEDRTISYPGIGDIEVLYHKHASREAATAELQEIDKELENAAETKMPLSE
jgi:hypothetical protein